MFLIIEEKLEMKCQVAEYAKETGTDTSSDVEIARCMKDRIDIIEKRF